MVCLTMTTPHEGLCMCVIALRQFVWLSVLEKDLFDLICAFGCVSVCLLLDGLWDLWLPKDGMYDTICLYMWFFNSVPVRSGYDVFDPM